MARGEAAGRVAAKERHRQGEQAIPQAALQRSAEPCFDARRREVARNLKQRRRDRDDKE
ncbi:MAG: hypothetical protein HC828_05560 [Blastochloris sp.]|nr:hypothetical protein [Blastochloris sp.]